MRDFVIDPSTTGKDVLDLLSEEEVACVRDAVGDATFPIILTTPIMQVAGADDADVVFNCLEIDNVILFGVAVDDFLVGGRSEETRACIADLALEHPELTYLRLGLEWKGEDTVPTGEQQSTVLRYIDCMTALEGARFVVLVYDAIDSQSPLRGGDLVGLVSESEQACIGEKLSQEQINILLTSTPTDGFRAAAPAADCLSPDTLAAVFITTIEAAVGSFTEDSAMCMSNYVDQHPAFLPLLTAALADLTTMPESSLREISDGNRAFFACFNEDEFVRLEDLVLKAYAALAAPS